MKKYIRIVGKIIVSIISIVCAIMILVFSLEKYSIFSIITSIIVVSLVVFFNVILLMNPGYKVIKHRASLRKVRKTEVTPEFQKIHKELEEKYGEYLEIYRKKTLKSIIYLVIAAIIALIVGIVIYIRTKMDLKLLAIMVGIIPACLSIKYIKYNKEYNIQFRKIIMKELVRLVDGYLDYNYDGKESCFRHYEEAKFEHEEEYNTYDCTDYIGGKFRKGESIEICNMSLLNCDDKGRVNNVIENFLFSYSNINNHVPNQVIIDKNRYKINSKNRVKLDDENFEKYFDVFSDSKIVAMEILTHDVMEEIINFYVQYKIQFKIIIRNNSIYIKYITGKVFQPSLLKKATNIQLLWFYYNLSKFVINLTIKTNKILGEIEI